MGCVPSKLKKTAEVESKSRNSSPTSKLINEIRSYRTQGKKFSIVVNSVEDSDSFVHK